jgi:hypothetical protein
LRAAKEGPNTPRTRDRTDEGEWPGDASAKADTVETSFADISGNGAVNTLSTDPLVETGVLRTAKEGPNTPRTRDRIDVGE